MGCISEEARERIKNILRQNADEQADIIIEFTESINAAIPDGNGKNAEEWAEKQAKAFADARKEMTEKFTETLKSKFSKIV